MTVISRRKMTPSTGKPTIGENFVGIIARQGVAGREPALSTSDLPTLL